uniref:Uncharacterized protein n=1 Tax=Anguilla anguilla TaxID=7936 RepID=A0A0E9PMU3_ANGAN
MQTSDRKALDQESNSVPSCRDVTVLFTAPLCCPQQAL